MERIMYGSIHSTCREQREINRLPLLYSDLTHIALAEPPVNLIHYQVCCVQVTNQESKVNKHPNPFLSTHYVGGGAENLRSLDCHHRFPIQALTLTAMGSPRQEELRSKASITTVRAGTTMVRSRRRVASLDPSHPRLG